MLNNVVLVGRLTKEVEVKELENGKKVANITLAIPRCFKNVDGIYETDFVTCTLWEGIAENTKEYCHKGDIIGIKGRIQCNDEIEHRNEIVADKVTFLSSSKSKDSEGE